VGFLDHSASRRLIASTDRVGKQLTQLLRVVSRRVKR
jgi:hypothetical protein